MANFDISTPVGLLKVVDRRTNVSAAGGGAGEGVSGMSATILDECHNIADIRAALTSHDSGYYTAAFLNTQTYSDLVFALRSELDSGYSVI